MPPPAGTGLDPAGYGREIEAAGFTSVWFPRMNSLADLASVEASGQAYVRPYSKMVQFLDQMGEVNAPVGLAALGPRMLGLSRDRTLGAHPYFTPPEHTRYSREALGPQPLLIPELAPGEPGAAAARDYAKRYLRLPNYTNNLKRFGFTDADIEGAGSDRLMSSVVPNGPLALAARLREHLAAGADHVLVQLVTEGGAFDAGGLRELTELVAGSAKLRAAKGVCASG